MPGSQNYQHWWFAAESGQEIQKVSRQVMIKDNVDFV